MEKLIIRSFPGKLSGRIKLPASKSISNRVLMIQALSSSGFQVHNLSEADDTLLMQKALESNEKDTYLANAGTAMRFLTAYFAARPGIEKILKGTDRMHQRPIAELVEPLKVMGADIQYFDKQGFPPIQIKGTQLKGGVIDVQTDNSSQFISALMMIGPTLPGGLTINLHGKKVSEPYMLMTLRIMQDFGIDLTYNAEMICIPQKPYIGVEYTVESDWSAAGYFFAMAALIPSELEFPGLMNTGLQGDARIIEFLKDFGVECLFTESGCVVKSHPKKPSSFSADMRGEPDLIPTMVALCCAANVTFKITGTSTLKLKESDRIQALQAELSKTGYELESGEDYVSYRSGSKGKNTQSALDTYNDHRLAMCFAILAAKEENLPITILDPSVTEKSYPDFFTELSGIGIEIS